MPHAAIRFSQLLALLCFLVAGVATLRHFWVHTDALSAEELKLVGGFLLAGTCLSYPRLFFKWATALAERWNAFKAPTPPPVLILALVGLALSRQAAAQATALPKVQLVSITRLYPDSTVRETWERVVSCAGPTRDTTKTFEEIKFFERDTLPQPAGTPVREGEWIAPDTIYITKGFIHDGWVVAHEMLHHALNGPPGDIKHPIEPFLYPCGLYTKAQAPVIGRAPVVNTPGRNVSAEPSPYYRYRVTDPLTNRLREPGL